MQCGTMYSLYSFVPGTEINFEIKIVRGIEWKDFMMAK